VADYATGYDKRFSSIPAATPTEVRVFWFDSEPTAFERWLGLFIQFFVMKRQGRAMVRYPAIGARLPIANSNAGRSTSSTDPT
jgi:hypothetical protein